MSGLPVWSPEELLARYEREPELRDVFVEGRGDERIYGAVLEDAHGESLAFYSAEVFEVDEATLSRDGFTPGAKQQLIWLSRRLARCGGPLLVRCVVDRDLDHWFGELESNRILLWTPFTAIESYFVVDATLRRILLRWASVKTTIDRTLLASLESVLRELYAFRLADRELGANLEWPSFERHLVQDGDRVTLDREAYLTALASRNGSRCDRSTVERAAGAWLAKLCGDIRNEMRGRDLVPLMSWAIRCWKGKRECSQHGALDGVLVLMATSVPELVNWSKQLCA